MPAYRVGGISRRPGQLKKAVYFRHCQFEDKSISMGLFRDSWSSVDSRIRPLLILAPGAILLVSYWLPTEWRQLLIIGLLLIALVFLYLVHDHRHRQVDQVALREYHQIEALLGLYRQVEMPFSFQGLRKYAASPDMLLTVLKTISRHKPRVIVELGSGSSTRMIDTYLEQTGSSALFYSVEHDRHYLEQTRAQLQAGRTHLVHCPLKEVELDGRTYSWYDLSGLQLEGRIDLLIVDGPPEQLNDQARYPAYSLFKDQLSDEAIILLDDAARPDEQRIIDRWMKQGAFRREDVPAEKGLTILYKQPS